MFALNRRQRRALGRAGAPLLYLTQKNPRKPKLGAHPFREIPHWYCGRHPVVIERDGVRIVIPPPL